MMRITSTKCQLLNNDLKQRHSFPVILLSNKVTMFDTVKSLKADL